MCFFFNDTATAEIYTLSLHDALPISAARPRVGAGGGHPAGLGGGSGGRRRRGRPAVAAVLARADRRGGRRRAAAVDRKSTRLNSSHANISYAVLCLKKKTKPAGAHLP